MKSTRDTLLTLATRVILLPLSILISVAISRILGPDGKGVFTYATLLISLIVSLGSIGFSAGTQYYVASRKYSAEDTYLSISFSAVVFGVALAGLFVVAYSFKIVLADFGDSRYATYIAISIPPAFLTLFHSRLLIATSSFIAENSFLVLNAVIPVVFLLGAMLLFNADISGVISVIPIYSFVSALVVLVLSFPGRNTRFRLDFNFIRESLMYGLKASVGNIALQLNLRFDQAILGSTVPIAQLGFYSIAVQFSELMWYVADSVSKVMLPRISGMSNPQDAADLTNRMCRLTLAITGAIGVALCAVSYWAVRFIYGEQFLPSATVIYILVPGKNAYQGAKLFAKYLSGRGFPDKVSYAQTVGSLLSFILYIVFIPRFGMIAAAFASGIGYGAATSVMWYFYQRETGTQWRDVILLKQDDITFASDRISELLARKSNPVELK